MLVTFGCLLHDIGKMSYRTGIRCKHSQSGYDVVQQVFGESVPQPILDCVRWHHSDAIRADRPECDNIAYIACIADNISSAADRREEGDGTGFDPTLPLSPIFLHLNQTETNGSRVSVEATTQSGELPLPYLENARLDNHNYKALLFQLKKKLGNLQPTEEWLNSLLAVMETFTTNIPASTSRGESPDISLFDHLKTTAAIGACISEYLRDTQQTDYHTALFKKKGQAAFWDTEAFLLYSADFSGIQKFIYTISSENALRTLRSRSFFLDFLMEHYVDELLTVCGVSRANLLYSGGGHCYLLLPNTAPVRQAADAWNTRFNEWLFDEFGTQLFLAHGYTACTANQLTNTPAKDTPYKQMFRRVSAAIAQHKLHRVTAQQLRRLNQQPLGDQGRECRICGRTTTLMKNRERCYWCGRFEDISNKIQDCSVYVVSNQPSPLANFSLPGATKDKVHICMTNQIEARSLMEQGDTIARIYTKNTFCTGMKYSACLYVGDHAFSNLMEELADNSTGIRRLAVCRMDVDDLGHAFVSGFEQLDKLDDKQFHYVTISRTSSFSRQMSLFFKRYINGILSKERDGNRLKLSIVYSGGDDVFLVGAWNDIIEAAIRIQQAFEEFTCGTLHISAGVGIFNSHFPIRSAALQTAELEQVAKEHITQPKDASGTCIKKNAIALFDSYEKQHVYSWSDFTDGVLGEKETVLKEFFDNNDDRGNSVLYRINELLKGVKEKGRINLARYAYLLARLEPSQKDARHKLYKNFCDKMYQWALDETSRGQLITAILLYVYQTRKESEKDGTKPEQKQQG